jgi:hypothetical protein
VRRTDGIPIQIRVGLNSGEVVVRSIESDLHMDYSAVGQTTHLAARIEQLAPPGGIMLTADTLLVGQRRPEQCHDAIAHDLVDGAFVAVDRLHHVLEDGVEELPRFLGIAVSKQLHRALQVREEHRHLLALPLQGGLGGEDLLGQVLRRVGLRRREARCGGRGRRQLAGRVGALLAELRAGAVLVSAPRARHQQSQLFGTFTYDRSSAVTDGQPSSFSVRSRSARRISMARATPSSPAAARP